MGWLDRLSGSETDSGRTAVAVRHPVVRSSYCGWLCDSGPDHNITFYYILETCRLTEIYLVGSCLSKCTFHIYTIGSTEKLPIDQYYQSGPVKAVTAMTSLILECN